jgi:hypothetical protein
MTVDVAPPPPSAVVDIARDKPATSLAVWAQGAREVQALANFLAGSELVPKQYRGKAVDLLACWLTGQEIGLPPMAALRSIDVIGGTPSLRAHAMRALVQSHGHEVQILESTDERCVIRGRLRDDGGWQEWQTVTWDMDRARRLGLAGKDQWKVQPRTMLIARATGEICRLIAADALYAVPYTTEELNDSDSVRANAERWDRASASARLLDGQPARAADTAIARSTDIVDAEPVEPGDAPDASNLPQQKLILQLLDQTGRQGARAAFEHISAVVGRVIRNSAELTSHEADQVINGLRAELAAKAAPGEVVEPWPEVARPADAS